MTFIETSSGEKFTPLAPVFADIRIVDIAHALARQCRFAGHCRHTYSVGEHSVRVSELLQKQRQPKPVQLWGLLHDASEAYLVDLPRPLKDDPAIGDPYKVVEARLMLAVCQRFGLPERQPDAVTHADEVLLSTEARDIMHGEKAYWRKLTAPPLRERIRPWLPEVAEFEFLRRYRELGGVT
jgi:hypothetical protein